MGVDEFWLGPPAGDILDRPELSEMRSGFETAAFNKRGVTTRAMDERGKQGRDLADRFECPLLVPAAYGKSRPSVTAKRR